MAGTPRALMDVGERLVREFDDLPAGSVLRCVARCAQNLQVAGISAAELPSTVEDVARQWLSRRYAI